MHHICLNCGKFRSGNIQTEIENPEHTDLQVGKLLIRESSDLGIVHEVVRDIIKILTGQDDGSDKEAMEAKTGKRELGVSCGGADDVVVGGDKTGFGAEGVLGDAGDIVVDRNCWGLQGVEHSHVLEGGWGQSVVGGYVGLKVGRKDCD